VVDRLTERFASDRGERESFQEFIARVGKKGVRSLLEDLMVVPGYDEAPELYRDWADPREYTISDIGVGECAGEIVSVAKFGLADAEREVFEASEYLDAGRAFEAMHGAFGAMLSAAKALIRAQTFDVPEDPETIVVQFRERLFDTGLFQDAHGGKRFAHFLFRMRNDPGDVSLEDARQTVEEAQLFIEAAYACEERLGQARAAAQ
jgi:sulfite reductase (ferredoxin)